MSKKLWPVYLLTILFVIGVAWFVLIGRDGGSNVPASTKQEDKTLITNSTKNDNNNGPQTDGGPVRETRYIEYSNQQYVVNADKRRVLYFYANWCPTCAAAQKAFQANPDRIPEDVVILRINYNDSDTDDSDKELAKKHGITYQHTFVQVDAEGNAVSRWNGGDFALLEANIK